MILLQVISTTQCSKKRLKTKPTKRKIHERKSCLIRGTIYNTPIPFLHSSIFRLNISYKPEFSTDIRRKVPVGRRGFSIKSSGVRTPRRTRFHSMVV